SGRCEYILEVIATCSEVGCNSRQLIAITGISRPPQTHLAKHLFYLTAGKRFAVGQLHSHGFRTTATARQLWVPPQIGIHTGAPIVIPAIVRRDKAVAEGRPINVILL